MRRRCSTNDARKHKSKVCLHEQARSILFKVCVHTKRCSKAQITAIHCFFILDQKKPLQESISYEKLKHLVADTTK
jgi:hypothetical protein